MTLYRAIHDTINPKRGRHFTINLLDRKEDDTHIKMYKDHRHKLFN
jgi:hypothetical protein